MKTATRWLLALGVVVAATIATNYYPVRDARVAGPFSTPTQSRANEPAPEEVGRRVPADGRSLDTTADTGETPAAAATENETLDTRDARRDAELVTDQSPSPFVRDWVRSLGRSRVPQAGPLPEKLRQFAAEPIDPISSRSVETRLLSAIAQSNIAVVDRRVECRATACSVLLVYPFGTEQDAVGDEIDHLTSSLGFPIREITIFSSPRADGAPSALVIYRLPRESTPQSVGPRSASG